MNTSNNVNTKTIAKEKQKKIEEKLSFLSVEIEESDHDVSSSFFRVFGEKKGNLNFLDFTQIYREIKKEGSSFNLDIL